jgi:hypothetical protein
MTPVTHAHGEHPCSPRPTQKTCSKKPFAQNPIAFHYSRRIQENYMSKNEREKLENQAGPIGNVHLARVPIR